MGFAERGSIALSVIIAGRRIVHSVSSSCVGVYRGTLRMILWEFRTYYYVTSILEMLSGINNQSGVATGLTSMGPLHAGPPSAWYLGTL